MGIAQLEDTRYGRTRKEARATGTPAAGVSYTASKNAASTRSIASLRSFSSLSSKSSLSNTSSTGSRLFMKTFRASPRKKTRLMPRAYKRGGRNKPIVVRDSSSGERKETDEGMPKKTSMVQNWASNVDAHADVRLCDSGPIKTLEELRLLQIRVLQTLSDRELSSRSKRKKLYQPLKLGTSHSSNLSRKPTNVSLVSNLTTDASVSSVIGPMAWQASSSGSGVLLNNQDLISKGEILVNNHSSVRCDVRSAKVIPVAKSMSTKSGATAVPEEAYAPEKNTERGTPHTQEGLLPVAPSIEVTPKVSGQEAQIVLYQTSSPPLKDKSDAETLCAKKSFTKVDENLLKKPMRHRDRTPRAPIDPTSSNIMSGTIHRPALTLAPRPVIIFPALFSPELTEPSKGTWNNDQAWTLGGKTVESPSVGAAVLTSHDSLALTLKTRRQVLKTDISAMEKQMNHLHDDQEEHSFNAEAGEDGVMVTPRARIDESRLEAQCMPRDHGKIVEATDSLFAPFSTVSKLLDIVVFPLKLVWRMAYNV